MLIPFGVLSAAGAGVVGGDYELIATEILGTATSSVTFSSLATYASTYKHLQVRYTARTTGAFVATGGIGIQLNSDTGNNYATHTLTGNGASVASSAFTSQAFVFVGFAAANLAASNIFGTAVFDILDAYSSSKNKTIRSLTGGHFASDNRSIALRSGLWLNTDAITTLRIDARDSSDFVAGSRFSLYGIKG
jgi:hypothetical protein